MADQPQIHISSAALKADIVTDRVVKGVGLRTPGSSNGLRGQSCSWSLRRPPVSPSSLTAGELCGPGPDGQRRLAGLPSQLTYCMIWMTAPERAFRRSSTCAPSPFRHAEFVKRVSTKKGFTLFLNPHAVLADHAHRQIIATSRCVGQRNGGLGLDRCRGADNTRHLSSNKHLPLQTTDHINVLGLRGSLVACQFGGSFPTYNSFIERQQKFQKTRAEESE